MTTSGPKVGKKCIIPFKFEGVFRHGCMVQAAHQNKPWCTVVRDSNGVAAYVPYKWGYCSDACPLGETHIEALIGCKCLIS